MKIPQIDPSASILLDSVDSTNTYCKSNNVVPGGWVLSEEQTRGRGRGNHEWKSLGRGNIFFSTKLEFIIQDTPNLTLLSLFFGFAILETLLYFLPEKKEEFSIKWPNDIYRNHKKISGILLEADTYSDKVHLIAGIGINLFNLQKIPTSDVFGTMYDTEISANLKVEIIYKLIDNLNFAIQKLFSNDIMRQISEIEKYSFLKNKEIRTKINGTYIVGRVIGFNESGFLRVVGHDGELILQDTGENFSIL